MMEIQSLGNMDVSVVVPSRFRDGTLIGPERRDAEVRRVRAVFGELYGGATDSSHMGTYAHTDGSGRIVDEVVTVVTAKTDAVKMNDATTRTRLEELSREVCRNLDQECVLFTAGDGAFLVVSDECKRYSRAFGELDAESQHGVLHGAWYRFRKPVHVVLILQLDGWKPNEDSIAEAGLGLCKALQIAEHPGGRSAWLTPNRAALKHVKLQHGDLVLDAEPVDGLDVFTVQVDEGLRGPRRLPYASGALLARPTLELMQAMLGGASLASLSDLLGRQHETKAFFAAYRAVFRGLEQYAVNAGVRPADAQRWAQRLLSRLMLLRFLEQRRWLERDPTWLRSQWAKRPGLFYSTVLLPAFGDLDGPDGCLPFLNGGLFDCHDVDSQLCPPDRYFDPVARGSVFELLYGYEFTMSASTRASDAVSVDPAMFGQVLESLMDPGARKEGGVHYTPEPIAHALAVEGLCQAIGARSGLGAQRIRDWWVSSTETLSEAEAELVDETLNKLRILDPAVGSGGLLVEMLDCLLDRARACQSILGGDLREGSRWWRRRCEFFIRRCLFGVDVSAEAVEVARLRLWLRLAVGDTKPRPFPHLGYNIQVGDSLLKSPVDAELERVAAAGKQGFLPTSDAARAMNRFAIARDAYLRVEAGASADARQRFDEMNDAAARVYRAVLEAADLDNQPHNAVAQAFAWRVRFSEVFGGPNEGFDLVIANPPYVREQSLPADVRRHLRANYRVMHGNTDLYLAFVERGLELAGKGGFLAFVLPNFSRTASGGPLRELLAEGGHVTRWVDFRDKYVFPTAYNFTALLFAQAARGSRKTFPAHVVAMGMVPEWAGEGRSARWLYELERAVHPETGRKEVPYRASDGGGRWGVRTRDEDSFFKRTSESATSLGEIASIHVGVQTSADRLLLVELAEHRSQRRDLVVVRNGAGEVFDVEAAFLKAAAKGSKDIDRWSCRSGRLLLWPYDDLGSPVPADALAARFPRAWAYLRRHEPALRRRKMLDSLPWWAFARQQGIDAATVPKVLVPAMLGPRKSEAGVVPARAALDERGEWSYTGSGAGGGGAWAVVPNDPEAYPARWLLAVFNGTRWWQWLQFRGDYRKDRFRGVDRSILAEFPVPTPTADHLASLDRILPDALTRPMDPERDAAIDAIVEAAWGADASKRFGG